METILGINIFNLVLLNVKNNYLRFNFPWLSLLGGEYTGTKRITYLLLLAPSQSPLLVLSLVSIFLSFPMEILLCEASMH